MTSNDPDMLDEYHFSNGVRGKYAEQYRAGANLALIDPDLHELFPTSEAVNRALRDYVKKLKESAT